MPLMLVVPAVVTAMLAASELTMQAQPNGVYQTQFENDWVRVIRVRYPANTKVPTHGHPSTVTTYVYLSESSPVRFTHHGGRTHVVTRQPTTPGAFRVSRGGDETHEAENLGPIASDFLRGRVAHTDPDLLVNQLELPAHADPGLLRVGVEALEALLREPGEEARLLTLVVQDAAFPLDPATPASARRWLEWLVLQCRRELADGDGDGDGDGDS